MNPQTKRLVGVIVFTLLYPLLRPVVEHIPNPMVPGAVVALNMIMPILAGYFYGPLSGAVAGGVGTAIAALLGVNMFDGLAILPHAIMGIAAGWLGQRRNDFLSSTTIMIGHVLNMLFFWRMGIFTITLNQLGVVLLGLVTETMIDIVAIILVIALLKRYLYQVERW